MCVNAFFIRKPSGGCTRAHGEAASGRPRPARELRRTGAPFRKPSGGCTRAHKEAALQGCRARRGSSVGPELH